jgi:hypothetical protein
MTTTADRCEVCNRTIRKRINPRKRRCADHVNIAPLFPLSVVPARKAPGKGRAR